MRLKKTSEKRIIYSCIFCGASVYYVIRPFVRSEYDMHIKLLLMWKRHGDIISIWRHKYSKLGTVRRGKLKNQNGLRTIVNGTQILGESTVVKKLTKKRDTKLYDIEVTEVDKANKRLKTHYVSYSTQFDE